MVEDEFLTTAKLYTRSIHAAEYARLQDAASRKNAWQISQISRPTVGGKDDTDKKSALAALRRSLPAKVMEDEFEEGGAELAGLMRGNAQSQTSLGRMIKHKPVATRAAAGLKEAKAKEGGARRLHAEQIRSPSPVPAHPLQTMRREDPRTSAGKKVAPAVSVMKMDELGDITSSDDDLDTSVRRRRTPAVKQEGNPVRMRAIQNWLPAPGNAPMKSSPLKPRNQSNPITVEDIPDLDDIFGFSSPVFRRKHRRPVQAEDSDE